MKLTSAQETRIQAVWPSSISPVPSPMVYGFLRVRGTWGGGGVGLGSVSLPVDEQQAMKTEGSAEGTDFVHRNRHVPGVRRRGIPERWDG